MHVYPDIVCIAEVHFSDVNSVTDILLTFQGIQVAIIIGNM